MSAPLEPTEAEAPRLAKGARRRLRARLQGPALVTGASDGIGRAFAVELAAAGVDLILVARRRPVLEALAATLRSRHGVTVEVHEADLGQDPAVEEVSALARQRRVGLAVLAAGFGTSGSFLRGDLAAERAMLAVNCAAPLAMTHALAGDMAARGGGTIVLFSSLVAFQGVPNAAHYAATKAYIQSLAEGLAPELRAAGVELVACSPGPVRSGFGGVAGMRMGAADTPATVAAGALAGLGSGAVTLRPGWVGRLLQGALATAPRRLRVWIMAHIMRGMVGHRLEEHGSR